MIELASHARRSAACTVRRDREIPRQGRPADGATRARPSPALACSTIIANATHNSNTTVAASDRIDSMPRECIARPSACARPPPASDPPPAPHSRRFGHLKLVTRHSATPPLCHSATSSLRRRSVASPVRGSVGFVLSFLPLLPLRFPFSRVHAVSVRWPQLRFPFCPSSPRPLRWLPLLGPGDHRDASPFAGSLIESAAPVAGAQVGQRTAHLPRRRSVTSPSRRGHCHWHTGVRRGRRGDPSRRRSKLHHRRARTARSDRARTRHRQESPSSINQLLPTLRCRTQPRQRRRDVECRSSDPASYRAACKVDPSPAARQTPFSKPSASYHQQRRRRR